MNKNRVNYQDEDIDENIMGKRKIYKSNSMVDIIDSKIKKKITKYIVFNEGKKYISIDDLKVYEQCYERKKENVQSFNVNESNIKKDNTVKPKEQKIKKKQYSYNEIKTILNILNLPIQYQKSIQKKKKKNIEKPIQNIYPEKYIHELEDEFRLKFHTSVNDPFYTKYIPITSSITYNIDAYNQLNDSIVNPSISDNFILLSKKHILSEKEIILQDKFISHNYIVYMILQNQINFHSIIELNLAFNKLTDCGGCFLLYLISKHSNSLINLNLSYNEIGKYSIHILTSILSQNKTPLKFLDISGNQIGDDLFNELLLSISNNSTLSHLYTSNNNLGYISSMMLGGILKYDSKLLLVDISNNNLLTDETINPVISSLVYNKKLEILILNDLHLSNKSLITLSSSLKQNTTLKILSLERNSFTNRGLSLLSSLLTQNTSLQYVILNGNKYTRYQISKSIAPEIGSIITKEAFIFELINQYSIEEVYKFIDIIITK